MDVLRNSWYCVGFSSSLADRPVGLTMLGEPLVFYRGAEGQPIALTGRCAHRFAPLDRGVVSGDEIMCPYHGLRYGSDGRCTHNPHGDGYIPPNAKLASYPIVEKNGALWVWMGDPAIADEGLLPNDDFIVDPSFSVRYGYLKINANYQLVIDNLLDLTHGLYLHPTTLSPPAEDSVGLKHSFRVEGDVVHSDYYFPMAPPAVQMRALVSEARGEVVAKMTWRPGSICSLDVRFYSEGAERENALRLPSVHYLVPETEFTTHYFVAVGRDRLIDSVELDDQMIGFVMRAFVDEDEPMIRACQDLMGTANLFDLKPAILRTDAPAVQARRILAKRIRNEQV